MQICENSEIILPLKFPNACSYHNGILPAVHIYYVLCVLEYCSDYSFSIYLHIVFSLCSACSRIQQ